MAENSLDLNVKDSLALTKALLNPVQPSNKLREAAKRYIAATSWGILSQKKRR